MAIRLSGSISRKIPIQGIEYSSQSVGASLEVEISNDDPASVQAKLLQLYASLNSGIDAQIAAASHATAVQNQPAPIPPPVQPRNGVAATNRIANVGNGNGKRVAATEAQQRAIFAICKAQNLDVAAVLADYNVADTRELPLRDASKLIDQLKARAAAH